MNITLEAGQKGLELFGRREGDILELFRRREGDIAHCLASKDFDFATGSEEQMLLGLYHVTTICGETYRYGRNSVYWIARHTREEQVRNACEACFYN